MSFGNEVDEFKLPGDNSNPDFGALGAVNNNDSPETLIGESELQSRKIEDALMKEEVSNVNVDRLENIESGTSCLVDFSKSKKPVVPSWLSALKNLIVASEKGVVTEDLARINETRKKRGQADIRADIAIYIKTKSGTMLAGYGDSLQIYRVLRSMVQASFKDEDEVKVYIGKGDKALFNEWKASDVNGVRLRL